MHIIAVKSITRRKISSVRKINDDYVRMREENLQSHNFDEIKKKKKKCCKKILF